MLNIPTIIALHRKLGPDVRFTFVGHPTRLEIVRDFLPEVAIEAIHSIEAPPWNGLFNGPIGALEFNAAVVWMKDETLSLNLRESGITCVFRADPFPVSGHAAEHLLRTLNLPAPPLPDLWCPLPESLVLLHPGSGSPKKCWPHFNSLADVLRADPKARSIGILIGPCEENFKTTLPKLEGLSLREVIAHLRACRGYIGNDSGMTHLAAYLGVPTVALFGPTDPRVWGPWGRRVRVIHKPSLSAISVREVIEYAKWMFRNRPT